MKIENPFDNAEITVNSNGKTEIKLICKPDAKVPLERNDKFYLLDELKQLLSAKYISIYPETEKDEE